MKTQIRPFGRKKLLFALSVGIAYFTPLLLLQSADAAATSCTSSAYQCVSEGAPSHTRAYAGQWSSAENKRAAKGALAATATTLTQPSENGFGHWYGVVDWTPPPGYGVNVEWTQAGFLNGTFSWLAGQPETSNYSWYNEVFSWCNGHYPTGAGSYTPGTTHVGESYQLDGSYDCGSNGQVTVYMTRTFFNGQVGTTGWILTYGSQLRADANTEYYPVTYLNPVGRVCFGSGAPTNSCTNSALYVQRLVSATWSNWSSSDTSLKNGFGYQRNNQLTNTRFNVTSIY